MRSIIYFCLFITFAGCATPIEVSTPLIQRAYPDGLTHGKKVLIVGFEKEGGECLKKEMEAYLNNSKKFVVIASPSQVLNDRQREEFIEKQSVKLLISGEIERYSADLRGADTALGGMNLIVYGIASAKVSVTDTDSDKVIWSKKDTAFVEGIGSRGNVKEILLPVACKNLAAKMLNDFLKSYASGGSQK